MLLKEVVVNKYKSYTTEQSFICEDKITRIVGKNESGKTALLEALAKTRYFTDDVKFKFAVDLDYPRTELKKFQDVRVVLCIYQLNYEIAAIEKEFGADFLGKNILELKYHYKSGMQYALTFDFKAFLNNFIKLYCDDSTKKGDVKKLDSYQKLKLFCEEYATDLPKASAKVKEIGDCVITYIYTKYLKDEVPYFWYFDEYYSLPGSINLTNGGANLTAEEKKTYDALVELVGVAVEQLKNESEYEKFKAELEATSNQLTDEMFKYWSTNKNLEIEFDIRHEGGVHSTTNRFLEVRIKNTSHRVTLPLKNRSKGFIWFFSFFVWFSKIQADKKKKYILLLDEPGLNLHASAQADLLKFMDEVLAKQYQVIYTTHSPFMIDVKKLNEIRTVFDSVDAKEGSRVSDTVQEKDPQTLFPLQAALGYDIAQNLFISPKNLLVEGVSDLMYLSSISAELIAAGRTGLDSDITIVPIGGMDKVASFISLMRGQNLNIVCMLDDSPQLQRLEDLKKEKIIKNNQILFFGEFAGVTGGKADLEDIFTKDEYLTLFNSAFPQPKGKGIVIADIKNATGKILPQINAIIKQDRFNHYLPANEFLKIIDKPAFLSDATKTKFEEMFKKINKAFK